MAVPSGRLRTVPLILQAVFIADLFRGRKNVAPIGIADDLDQAFAIAQVDEDHAAVVAPAVHPAKQGDRLADIGCVQEAAVLGSHGFSGAAKRGAADSAAAII